MPTPGSRYGLHETTGHAFVLAAADLSRAITGLKAHHELAPSAISDAYSTATAGPPPTSPLVKDSLDRVLTLSSRIDDARGDLLETLAPLREPLADLILDVLRTLPAGAQIHIDVEPDPPQPAPEAEEHFRAQDGIRLLVDTLTWNRRQSFDGALLAGKPSYLLSLMLEDPAPAARQLRGECTAAIRALDGFARLLFGFED
jgi:hypothetical protein